MLELWSWPQWLTTTRELPPPFSQPRGVAAGAERRAFDGRSRSVFGRRQPPTPLPGSLDARRAPLPLQEPAALPSLLPQSGFFSLCFGLRLKAWSIPFPGEKGGFPEAAVGQTDGERKKGRLGEGCLEDRAQLQLLGLPCPWPRRGWPGCRGPRASLARVSGIATCHQVCGKCSPLLQALCGSCFPHHT